MNLNDTLIEAAAYGLRTRLEHMLEALEVYEHQQTRPAETARPLCQSSNLDFITDIGPTTPRKWFGPQLALCASCLVREPCLDIAVDEGRRFGIWGGKMPKER